jgi:hypothetical protein
MSGVARLTHRTQLRDIMTSRATTPVFLCDIANLRVESSRSNNLNFPTCCLNGDAIYFYATRFLKDLTPEDNHVGMSRCERSDRIPTISAIGAKVPQSLGTRDCECYVFDLNLEGAQVGNRSRDAILHRWHKTGDSWFDAKPHTVVPKLPEQGDESKQRAKCSKNEADNRWSIKAVHQTFHSVSIVARQPFYRRGAGGPAFQA